METITDEMISQEAGPTLQLKRPLLPIDEYAAREGVSRDIVEECGKLGIVQIRKYKGKTFVVDVPLGPYSYTPETTDEPSELINETVETKETLESAQIIQDSGIQLGLLTAQTRSKRAWQIIAVFSTAFLFTALFGNLWFYMDRKIQLDRIDQAYASIQQLLNDSTQAKQQIETVQNELAQARQNLETIQNRNVEAMERLNKQIQRLTDQLPELTKNRQTPPGPGISGK